MANHSKITLYVASVTAGDGVRTVVKPKIVVSSDRVRDVLLKHVPMIADRLEVEMEESRFEGKVKTPASLDVATTMLIHYIAPAVSVFKETGNRLGVEVMFNDNTINTAAKLDSLTKWRVNDFQFRKVHRVKHPIPHASKWQVFDDVLNRLGGTLLWYNGDVTLRSLVDSLKNKPQRRNKDGTFSSDIVAGD